MKLRNECVSHRQGTLVGIADWIQEITHVQYDDDLNEEQKDIKIDNLIREMRNFDITTIGDLYLTSGGRIVLDKGYGEYFMDVFFVQMVQLVSREVDKAESWIQIDGVYKS